MLPKKTEKNGQNISYLAEVKSEKNEKSNTSKQWTDEQENDEKVRYRPAVWKQRKQLTVGFLCEMAE